MAGMSIASRKRAGSWIGGRTRGVGFPAHAKGVPVYIPPSSRKSSSLKLFAFSNILFSKQKGVLAAGDTAVVPEFVAVEEAEKLGGRGTFCSHLTIPATQHVDIEAFCTQDLASFQYGCPARLLTLTADLRRAQAGNLHRCTCRPSLWCRCDGPNGSTARPNPNCRPETHGRCLKRVL